MSGAAAPSSRTVLCIPSGSSISRLRNIGSGSPAAASTTALVDAGDVAHQLARGNRPPLLWIRGNVRLNRGIEIDAPALVKQGDGSRQRFRDASKTELRARRHRHAVLEVCPAEALGPDDLAIAGNGHREARQVLFQEQRVRQATGLLDGS